MFFIFKTEIQFTKKYCYTANKRLKYIYFATQYYTNKMFCQMSAGKHALSFYNIFLGFI